MLADLGGKTSTLSKGWFSVQGLAWSPDGREVWFTGARRGLARSLHAVTLDGAERVLYTAPNTLTLTDVSHDGRALVIEDDVRGGMIGLAPGGAQERDLSWLDYSSPGGISSDGTSVVFDESGQGGGGTYTTYHRTTNASAAVRLGAGSAFDVSPDGQWVMSRATNPSRFVLYPVKAGEPKLLAPDGLDVQGTAGRFLPDGQRFLFAAGERGKGRALYILDLAGGAPHAVTPEGVGFSALFVSPDGRLALTRGPEHKLWLYPLAARGEGGEPAAPRPMPGELGDSPAGFSADGGAVYTYLRGEVPCRVWRVDVASGAKTLWRTIVPADAAGVRTISPVLTAANGAAYVYGYVRVLSTLYLVNGLK
jgi:Tol biopolymer transport system component